LRKCLEDKIFSRNDVINYGLQVLDILDYVHEKGIVHRDLKPENLILGDDGDMYVVDFGAVKLRYFSGKSTKRSVVGTFGYQAPEQFCGHAVPASDIYSLGAVMIEMLTGLGMEENYVDGRENLYTRRVVLPEVIDFGLRSVLQRMVEMDVSRRYQNVQEVIRDLSSLNGQEKVLQRRNGFDINLVDVMRNHYRSLAEGCYLKEMANRDLVLFLLTSGFENAELNNNGNGFFVRTSGSCLEVCVHNININLHALRYIVLKNKSWLSKFIRNYEYYIGEIAPDDFIVELRNFWSKSVNSPELFDRLKLVHFDWNCNYNPGSVRGFWNFFFNGKKRNKALQRVKNPATPDELEEWKPYLGRIALGRDAFESIVFANSQR
jgi:serine/threonine protein kinase